MSVGTAVLVHGAWSNPAARLGVHRLIYVAAVPGLPPNDPVPPAPDAPVDLTHVLFGDGTAVLDNDWFLTSDPAVRTLPGDVVEHLGANPRRPIALTAVLEPPGRAAWREVGTTVILGASDELVPTAQQNWARANIADTRVVDCDHFILFREPRLLANVIVEALAT